MLTADSCGIFFYPFCSIFEIRSSIDCFTYSVHLNVSKFSMFVQYGFVLVGALIVMGSSCGNSRLITNGSI